jgi:prolyl-tRNA synthetase
MLVQFTDENGQREYIWQTSWAVSTRFVGGIIMTHGDDAGLMLPPKIAPIQVRMDAIGVEIMCSFLVVGILCTLIRQI